MLETSENTVRLYLHIRLLDYLNYWVSTLRFPDQDNEDVESLLIQLKKIGKLVTIETKSQISLVFGPQRTVEVTPLNSGYDVGCIM